MDSSVSPLERARAAYRPRRPRLLESGLGSLRLSGGEPTAAVRDAEQIRQAFPQTYGRAVQHFEAGNGPTPRPLQVGVVLSGGQAPGGHNVIAGLYDALAEFDSRSTLFGFLGGPRGVFTGQFRELDAEAIRPYRNTGGFDLIGSGRDKIETDEQFAACADQCRRMGLDGLIIVGGDDSNTNAAVLAEHFLTRNVPTQVIGVPKTIDGDLRGGPIEMSFGFDTATRIYSELIGNIARDSKSAGKYWHFIKLMGRAASHVTLECALRCRPNVALIGEEAAQRGWTLRQVVEQVADVVAGRAAAGKHYGVCLVPEGLIEFIPEIRELIARLNQLLVEKSANFETLATMDEKRGFVSQRLPEQLATVFDYLPERIQAQLLLDRDSHGNVQVSKIDTEQLLSEQVARILAERKAAGSFDGKFQVQHHFLGYEGRSAAPSNFDADYTYALGTTAAALIAAEQTGYLACVAGLAAAPAERQALGIPLTSLMQMEMRKGKPTPVIGKALVDLDGPAFAELDRQRQAWAAEDAYRYPGPIQYFGPEELADQVPRTVELETGRASA